MPNEIDTETETSLRDDILAAQAELENASVETPDEESVEEPVETPDGESAEAPDGESAEAPGDGRERDERGRFKAKDEAAGPAGAAEPAAREQPADAAAAASAGAPSAEPVERAPQSWRPAAREQWAKMPAEARQEVLRREQETSRVLQESAQARRGYHEFLEAVRPYEANIRASGARSAAEAVAGLLQTEHMLRVAPPVQKAQILANLIHGYGVPIDVLDSVLAGQTPPAQSQQPMRDPRVDELYQRLEQAERARVQAAHSAMQTLVDEFKTNHEFFEDVRLVMADLLEVAARQNRKLSLEEAYNTAIRLDPDLSKIVNQREAAKAAASAKAQAQRARAASSSVPSRPAVAPPRSKENGTLRDDIEESFRELQGR